MGTVLTYIAGIPVFNKSTNHGVTWECYGDNLTTPSCIAWSPSLSLYVTSSAGTASGIVLTSPDGITWTSTYLGVATSQLSAAWNGSVFCIATTGTVVWTSSDGISWSSHIVISGSTKGFCAGGVSGNLLVLVANGTASATSTNGTSWTTTGVLPTSTAWSLVAWNGSVFFACANTGTAGATSTDGLSWTSVTLPTSASWSGLAWNGTTFCLIANGSSTTCTSADGTTWTANTSAMPSSTTWTGISAKGATFVAVAINSIAAMSTDGVHWSTTTTGGTLLSGIVGNNGSTFTVLGIYSSNISPDGISWTTYAAPAALFPFVSDMLYTGSQWVAFGSTNHIATSTNGLDWTAYKVAGLTAGVSWVGLMYVDNKYYMAASNQWVATSVDGVNWLNRQASSLPTNITVSHLAWNGTVFVLTSASTTSFITAVSSDFFNWTCYLPLTSILENYNGPLVTDNSGNFYQFGTNGADVLKSSDGINWTRLANVLPASTSWSDCVYNGSAFMLVSSATNAAAYSTDGSTWSSHPTPFSGSNGVLAGGLVWDGSAFIAIPASTTNNFATASFTNPITGWTESTALPEGGGGGSANLLVSDYVQAIPTWHLLATRMVGSSSITALPPTINCLDFGIYPGSNETSMVVTGQTGILTTSVIEAWTMAEAYGDGSVHSANDVIYGSNEITLSCGNIIPGVGFTIYARSLQKLMGKFPVRWVWV